MFKGTFHPEELNQTLSEGGFERFKLYISNEKKFGLSYSDFRLIILETQIEVKYDIYNEIGSTISFLARPC